jgi:hypothetical protein
MKAVLAILCFSLGSAIAAEARLPADVAKFIEQREGCDHFRGEMPDPSEKQRMKEVERELRKLCTGTDKKLAQLKRKYAGNPVVMKRLDEFEEKIE